MPVWKRVADVCFSVLGLVLSSPVFLVSVVLIPLTSPGPAFYISDRVGLGGRVFRMIKFRTLRTDYDFNVPRLTYNEPLKATEGSITGYIPGGQLLRKLGLDDIPQFFNVLQGEMSLIGPRPCQIDEAEIYLHWHKRRFDIVPGIIGLWQVRGKYSLSLREKVRLDIHYAENLSIWMDLKILFLLIPSRFIDWKKRLESPDPTGDDQSTDPDQSGLLS